MMILLRNDTSETSLGFMASIHSKVHIISFLWSLL